jgi:hypothetical protein
VERIVSHSKRAQTQEERAAQKKVREEKIREILAGLPPNRLGFSPAEFAALNNKSATWGYRRIYCGDVKLLAGAGRFLIPRREIDAFLARAAAYNPKPKLKAAKGEGAEQ